MASPPGCTDVDARPALFESRQEAVPTETLPPATILVVDDEPVVSRLVSRYLTHIGYQVVEASSGELALGVVRRRRPPIDVVLSDIVMPEIDGLELAAAVLAESPGPSVLLMTGQLPEGVERIEVGRRIVQVVRKPLNLDGLRELLQVILDGYPPDAPAEPASYAGS
jgi:two-component system, cell cycle sensor histidine kinase and response regulator CckA